MSTVKSDLTLPQGMTFTKERAPLKLKDESLPGC